ncbi:MAG: response regulator [Microscillaceae bacterium]|nr:response regulator [Microscillaceae bacterium]
MDKKRILIAEDSSVIQNISRKVLEFQNFDIDSAKDGKEVLKMLEKTHYDAILMDINMPKMDGMECARQIRALADEVKSQIPIIAITGNAKNYSMEDFQKAGINDYLPKPINFDSLIDILKKVTE